MIVAFKWVLENEYGFEKWGERKRREGILGGRQERRDSRSSMHKTMETGELKLCLRMIKGNPYIRRLPQCPTHKSKPRSAALTGNASLSRSLTPVTILQLSFS